MTLKCLSALRKGVTALSRGLEAACGFLISSKRRLVMSSSSWSIQPARSDEREAKQRVCQSRGEREADDTRYLPLVIIDTNGSHHKIH